MSQVIPVKDQQIDYENIDTNFKKVPRVSHTGYNKKFENF